MIKKLASLNNLQYKAKRLHTRFDFKTQEPLEKPVSQTNRNGFESDVDSMLVSANELVFITIKDNHNFAKEELRKLQNLLVEGNKILLSDGTNGQMSNLVLKEVKSIMDLLYIIESNPEKFKDIVQKTKHFFNPNWFYEIATNLQISNDISIFFNELNGGSNALRIKNAIINPLNKDIDVYGIDRDIDWGADSRRKGIESARGGIAESSSYWADLSFCANYTVDFSTEEWASTLKSELNVFYKERLARKDGYLIFNYPFYRIERIKHIMENNELIVAINTRDELGNIVFIMKIGKTTEKSRRTLRKILFHSQQLPSFLPSPVHYYSDKKIKVKTFRGKYIDLDDIKSEFKESEDSAEFLFEYYQPKNKLQQLSRPLIEYKPGHIPAMATSEIINGRYIDDILKPRVGTNFGFDHLFSTKIVKREFEEIEKKIDKDGNEITEISQKKNNIIVSTALTANGQYIELFSNEMNDED